MAKSLGNYRTVAELLDEHPLNGRAFRLLVLQTHYRKTMEVNAELMASARAAGERLDALARRATVLNIPPESVGADDLDESAVNAFHAAMDDDLGTPQAVAVIFDTRRKANAAIDAGTEDAATLALTARELAKALGIYVQRTGGRPAWEAHVWCARRDGHGGSFRRGHRGPGGPASGRPRGQGLGGRRRPARRACSTRRDRGGHPGRPGLAPGVNCRRTKLVRLVGMQWLLRRQYRAGENDRSESAAGEGDPPKVCRV